MAHDSVFVGTAHIRVGAGGLQTGLGGGSFGRRWPGPGASGTVGWRVSVGKQGFGTASLSPLFDPQGEVGTPCLIREARQAYIAHLDGGARMAGAIEGQ